MHIPKARSAFVGMTPYERIGILIFLCMLALGAGTVSISQGDSSLVLVSLAFLTYVIVLAIPFILYRSSWGWLHPLIFWVLWAGLVRSVLPKASVYMYGLPSHLAMPGASSPELNAIVVEALLLTALGWMVLYLAFISFPRMYAPHLIFRPPKRIFFKTSIIAIISLVAFLLLAAKAGGIGALLMQRGLPSYLRVTADPTANILVYSVGLLEPACLVWFSLKESAWRNTAWRCFFILAIVIGYMATGSRSGVVMPMIMAGVIWMLHNKRVPYVAVVVGFVVAMAVLGIGGSFRQASVGAESISEVDFESGLSEGVASGFSGMVDYGTKVNGTYAILAKVPDEVDFLYGESYLSIPFAFIPSALLPFEKPSAAGRLTSERLYGNPFNTIPAGDIGEAYWNFGLPGVIIVMALFGIALRWLQSFYEKNKGSTEVVAFYVASLFFLRPSSDAFYTWIHAVVPIIVLVFIYSGFPLTRKAYRRATSGFGEV